ncbi:conserved hypothetical protein [Leishmania infantum JPCM5]|uniref:Uncharacterized protein n=1 Tax=Leishmania infantum TaxID=5671 RepID=A4IAX1_LEIIN|nr:conserved hypothetical protein [Leishmania infantum JPCM5]CAM71982.2 conserved hypothetical protein [Leishmania infantum JPCM5]|eukprot:XP_001468890.2 conserved hypothetical protein [Leishmania infantum JPCM5]
MPRRKASRKAASTVAAASHDSPVSSHPGEPAAFQLAVVNSCLCNEDVRLPRLPTPALLTPFYAQYESTAAAASLRTTSPWKSDYWCTKVAHVALGRHSALPAVYRLRHECAGRLHARVVYVQAAAVHRQLYKAYPPLPRSKTHATTVGEVGDDDDVVIVEPTTRGDVVAGPAGPPPPTAFKASYYLLINHSENPIFVGPDRVPQGRSVVLREGDVLSFLECAFDEDSGVLDEAGVADGGGGAEGHCKGTSIDAEAVECAATTVEQVQQLAAESLWRCVDTSTAGSASRSSSSSFTAHQVRVPHRIVATRRFYEVPHVVQEYMRWWHRHTTQLFEQRHVNGRHTASPANEPMGATFSWMVSGNHLVRAPSIANSGIGFVAPACAKAEGAYDISAASAGQLSSPPPLCSQRRGSRSPSPLPRMQQRQQRRFSEDLLKTPAVVTALSQWLKDTEDMEEVTDEVHSPLAARLLLDRAWLWRLVRRHHRQQATPQPQSSSPAARDAFSSSLKLEDKTTTTTTAGLACAATVKKREVVEPGSVPPQLGGSPSPQSASDDVAERFRISVPTVLGDPLATGHGASLALTTTPSRAASVVQAVLEELRQSHGKKKSPASEQGAHALLPPLFGNEPKAGTEVARTAPDVRRTLCLDAEPIHVYANSNTHSAARPVSGEASQWPLKRLSSPAVSVGMPTCVPAVRIRPAMLPVYVFTRRSPSPDAYTREQSSFTHARSLSALAPLPAPSRIISHDHEEARGDKVVVGGTVSRGRPPVAAQRVILRPRWSSRRRRYPQQRRCLRMSHTQIRARTKTASSGSMSQRRLRRCRVLPRHENDGRARRPQLRARDAPLRRYRRRRRRKRPVPMAPPLHSKRRRQRRLRSRSHHGTPRQLHASARGRQRRYDGEFIWQGAKEGCGTSGPLPPLLHRNPLRTHMDNNKI